MKIKNYSFLLIFNMNLQEQIRKVLREERKLSNFLLRRLEMLDYEVESRLDNTFGGIHWSSGNICLFFKNEVDFFETIMEESIDSMYYNYFSHIDDNSGEWAHEYLDMVDYIRKKYQYKIMKHYDDNCGSGSIPLKESIRRVLREETNVPLSFRRRITNSDTEEEFLKALDSIDYSRRHNQFSPIKNISLKTFAKLVIDEMYMYLEKDYFSDEDSLLFDDDKIYHEKIRVPLMSYFGDRIKKRYNGNNINESESIRRVLSESINKSDEKRNKLIKKIMDNIIFTEYNHIICGYDVKNDEVFNKPVVNVTFIGGYGTKLWPVTQGIQKMYSDILDEIWNTIYDYINIPVGVTMNTTTKCL